MHEPKRFEILATCRFMLNFLNLCSRNGFSIKNVKVPNLVFYTVFFSPLVYNFVTVIWLILEEDMEYQKRSNVACVVVAYLQVMLTYMSMIKSNKFTMDTIEHIQEIVDKRCENTPESLRIYEKCEEKNAKLVIIVWKFGLLFVCVLFFVPLLFPLGHAIFSYPPRRLWTLSIPSKCPMDKETYFGFIVCVFIQSFGNVSWTMAFVAPLTLYIGLCSYIVAHAKDFRTIMTRLDDQLLLNSFKSKKTKLKRGIIDINTILSGIFQEAYETHLDLFKMLENTRKAVSGYLYYQFLFTLNYIAYVIFGMDGVAKELNFNALIIYGFLLTSISLNFILCYYADNLTKRACGIGDDLYSSQWFEMPNSYQKLLLVPICRSQKPFTLTGFGIFTYSLQNFARILLRSQFTRLMMFQLTGNRSPTLMLVRDITNMNI